MGSDPNVNCPLCGADAWPFVPGAARGALRCGVCRLTFVPECGQLSPAAERERYARHRNGPGDAGYRGFLNRLLAPLAERLAPGAEGLDFGCGPGPAVSVMMQERGFRMRDWDPFFMPEEDPLAADYDFITCTEVLEHLRRPRETLERLDGLLRPGGLLGVMTLLLEDDDAFGAWWYARDPTHIAFYRPETLEWIAAWRGWSLERLPRGAALLRKPLRASESL